LGLTPALGPAIRQPSILPPAEEQAENRDMTDQT